MKSAKWDVQDAQQITSKAAFCMPHVALIVGVKQ